MTASITEHLTHVREVLADAVVDDPEAGIYRANRRIFTDEEIFELEMKHIFEGNWIYLAHESQIAERQRLPHHLHRPPAGRHHAQTRTAS